MTLLKDNLTKLFDKYAKSDNESVSKIASRGFVYSEIDPNKKILFIGINPSFPKDSDPKIKDFSYNPIEAVTGYASHYKRFQDLADSCECNIGSDWTYMDLLFLRETDQKNVTALLKHQLGTSFICDQLKLSMELLEKGLHPKLIIVCNSGAGQFLGIDKIQGKDGKYFNVWMGYEFEFDEKFGVHVITGICNESISEVKTKNLIGTPVLFTSSLTYMHTWTNKRLAWQIRKILKFHDIFFGLNYNSDNRLKILLRQLENLTEQLEQTKKLKIAEVAGQDYIQASELRDVELSETKKIVEYILSVLLSS